MDLLKSKKARMMLIGLVAELFALVLTWLAMPIGEEAKVRITELIVLTMAGIASAYLGSQGLSDGFGKGKVEAEQKSLTTASSLLLLLFLPFILVG